MMSKKEKEQLKERTIALLIHLGIKENQAAFARKVKVTPQGLSGVYKGKHMPTLKMLANMEQAFPHQVNWRWLMTGDGDMIPKIQVQKIDNKTDHASNEVVNTQAYYLDKISEKDEKIHQLNDLIIQLSKEKDELNKRVITMLESQIKSMQ